MSSSLVFNNLKLQGHGSLGTMSVDEKEVRWVPRSGTAKHMGNIGRAFWAVFGKYGALSLYDKDGELGMRVDGFRRSDRDKLEDELSKIGVDLDEREYSSQGTWHGSFHFEASSLVLDNDHRVLELDLRTVSQCVLPANTKEPKELTMQFVETDAGDADEHQLVEMRLYVPNVAATEDEEGQVDDVPAAARLQQQITRIAKTDTHGKTIAEFADGTFLVPRGRYAVEMYGTYFRMHGNMYDYKIAYTDVERFYLLPRDMNYIFILCLEKPIRQGQQRYSYLVWQLKTTETELEINSDIDGLEREGPLYQLVARVFKVLASKKIFSVGKFKTADDRHQISCSVKAKTGHLYPLEKSFVFIHQPTLVLRFEDISSVEFDRFNKASRNFDLKVTMKSMGETKVEEHIFTNIEREHYSPLLKFLGEKRLKLLGVTEEEPNKRANLDEILGEDDDDDDDDHDDEEEEEDGDFNPSKKDDDDDDDDDDEDEEEEEEEEEEEAPKSSSKKRKEPPPPKPKPKPKNKKAATAAAASASSSSKKTASSKKSKAKAEAAASSKKPAAKKRKKDPNAPKGKISPYIFFSTAKRPEIKAENPSIRE
ncbi:hypothetical protein CTAYLR_005365 [Chrysophaeum taylorii]|uniref:FACT complex subunit SSRP1 n=1 Tax=Chrysophaeum taylorii TaxID=2483200 RepID=A0AAD7U8J2_9STRA|nr:hypothetical protein CTAYLR_005365 [Chrysophaeum taylorii]